MGLEGEGVNCLGEVGEGEGILRQLGGVETLNLGWSLIGNLEEVDRIVGALGGVRVLLLRSVTLFLLDSSNLPNPTPQLEPLPPPLATPVPPFLPHAHHTAPKPYALHLVRGPPPRSFSARARAPPARVERTYFPRFPS